MKTNTKLTVICRLWSPGMNLVSRNKLFLGLLLVGFLAIGSFAEAAGFCSFLFGKKEKISYHVGQPVKSEDFPEPQYSVFFLGAGSYGQVNRVVNEKNGTSFVIKSYKSSAALENDQRMFRYLRKYKPEKYGIRVVKELKLLKPTMMSYEDVKGITLGDAVARNVLPEKEMQALLDNLLKFQQSILTGIEKSSSGTGHIYFTESESGHGGGIPCLVGTSVGFMGKGDIYLNEKNILLDVETRKLVIIDPL